MTSDRWNRIQKIAIAAWELPEDSRAACVLELSGEDAELSLEVRALVEAREEMDRWTAPEPAAKSGLRRFGLYELEQMIGRGGMGAVYLAHRADGEFEKRSPSRSWACRSSWSLCGSASNKSDRTWPT